MPDARRGSMLFLLIVLVAVLTLIAFAFVRMVQINTGASKADSIFLLTQGAAQAGLDHAIESILADYGKSSVKLRTGSGGIATISDPPTVLEGAWRQPFTGILRPNTRHNYGAVSDRDDRRSWDEVGSEDQIDAPFTVFWWYGWNYASGSPFNNGYTYHDGRGRFYEPGFLNRPWIGSGSGTPPTLPAVPVGFTDPVPAVPDRAKGLWLDERLCPIDEADPVLARRLARYRLRYAIGVDDLDGKLLANGDAWLENPQVTDTDPAGALAAAGSSGGESNLSRLQRLVRWSPVMYNLMQASAGTNAALRAEHVFLNRGSAANYAKGPDGYPVTYPMMWREVQLGSGTPGRWTTFGYSPNNTVPTQLYQYVNGSGDLVTAPALAGGSPLSQEAASLHQTLGGPQYSFENLRLANSNLLEDGNADVAKRIYHRLFTPFGRGWSASAEDPAYRSDVDAPWRVNVMTAPRNAVSAMLNAYIPWRTRTAHFDSIVYYGQNRTAKNGSDFPHKGENLTYTADVDRAEPSRDCFNRKFSPAFLGYRAPTKASGIDSGLEPNWWTADLRSCADRYPGPLMAAEPIASLAAGQAPDDCGKLVTTMDTSAANWTTAGWCIYSQGGFFNSPGDVGCAPPSDPGTTAPPDWLTRMESNENDGNGKPVSHYVWSWAYLKASAQKYTYKDSYFFDMAWSMAQAVSVLRMQWSQYDNGYGTSWAPTQDKNFTPASLRDPSSYRTLADLDRILLQNLGIDIDHPASDTVADGWVIQWLWMDPWKVSRGPVAGENIRSLRKKDKLASAPAGAYDSLNRSRVMELVLNDFRMSFLGSNPDYRGQFRPLDFNGDGVVHCSAYPSNPVDLPRPAVADNAAEGALPALLDPLTAAKLHLDQWKPVAVDDQGPAADNAFSIAGNFFIGKSRYYHVVTRGELWDNLLQRPVSGLTLDSVVAVDPAGAGAAGANGASVLYQRYHWNKYRANSSRTGE